MNRSALVAAVVATVLIGGGAAWWFGQGTEAPTTGVTAPPVATVSTAEQEASDVAPSTTAASDVTTDSL
ncbi:MAG TPA: hypothetical protein VLB67_12315, partial [Acidimicrobiia bacterium]|nr:hypothetical protein [Acidimicrobiia bacterium]